MTVEKRAVRPKAGPEVWRERVERWRTSGLQAKAFAEQENLSARSLTWWKWRLRHEGSASPVTRVVRGRRPAPISFVPVVVNPARADEGEPIEVFTGNARVVVRAGFDEATLLRIVRVLGGSE